MKKEILMGLTALLINCNPTQGSSNSNSVYNTTASKVQLAQCLAENATMYGAEWCGWCNKQKEEFGEKAWNAFKKSYVECSDSGSERDQAKCEKDNVHSFPYWKFKNGKEARGYQPLEDLAKISGCD